MFKSKIAMNESTFSEIYIPGNYNPDISFGIYSSDIVQTILNEVKEYIAKNIEQKKYVNSINDEFFKNATIFVHGKELSCDDYDNEELLSRIDAKYEELFRNQFGEISDEEFDERIAALNSYEYFGDDDVPEIREVKIFGKEE